MLQIDSKSLLKKFTNRFTKRQDTRQKTAGILVVQFNTCNEGLVVNSSFVSH